MARHDLYSFKKYCWGSLRAVQKAVIIIHLFFFLKRLSSEIFRLNVGICCLSAVTDCLLIKLVEYAAHVCCPLLWDLSVTFLCLELGFMRRYALYAGKIPFKPICFSKTSTLTASQCSSCESHRHPGGPSLSCNASCCCFPFTCWERVLINKTRASMCAQIQSGPSFKLSVISRAPDWPHEHFSRTNPGFPSSPSV